MLLPYYIAALNIEHAYYEQTGEYEPFEGLCFVDTLDLAESRHSASSAFMTEENTERVERQKKTPITVIIGNPPYNAGKLNENDNNKNRKYAVIDRRIQETYAQDSRQQRTSKLCDPYVKFFRWATDRLQGEMGSSAFVSKQQLRRSDSPSTGCGSTCARTLHAIYHLDLDGQCPPEPQTRRHHLQRVRHSGRCRHHRRGPFGQAQGEPPIPRPSGQEPAREAKLRSLAEQGSIAGVDWQTLVPDLRGTWLKAEHGDEFQALWRSAARTPKTPKRWWKVLFSSCTALGSRRTAML